VNPWALLLNELDLWANDNRIATMWWRDDDASDISPALTTLITASGDRHIPIMLAVIPTLLSDDFKSHTFPPAVRLAQHGYAHTNHSKIIRH